MVREPLQVLAAYESGIANVVCFLTETVIAEQLALTPPRTEGPFYPDRLPLDTDNDLILVNDSLTPAVGEITHLTGRVLDASGREIFSALTSDENSRPSSTFTPVAAAVMPRSASGGMALAVARDFRA